MPLRNKHKIYACDLIVPNCSISSAYTETVSIHIQLVCELIEEHYHLLVTSPELSPCLPCERTPIGRWPEGVRPFRASTLSRSALSGRKGREGEERGKGGKEKKGGREGRRRKGEGREGEEMGRGGKEKKGGGEGRRRKGEGRDGGRKERREGGTCRKGEKQLKVYWLYT